MKEVNTKNSEEVQAECTQCPTDLTELVFNTQQQIDDYFIDYPYCTELQISLRVEGSDITNLNGLNGITALDGIRIINNPLLTDVDGLNSVTDFDYEFNSALEVTNNPLLTNLIGLSNAVNDNPMDLYIISNPQLVSLNGLQGIQGYGYSITIFNNDLLIDFTGLNGFTGMDDFYVEDNEALASFNGLDNLNVQNTGSFVFVNNDAMTSFSSLNSITPLCGFTIRDNDLLTDIDGFVDTYVEGCGASITIENNPNLTLCNTDFVCSAIPYLDNFYISNNASGCNATYEITNACEIAPYNDEPCIGFYGIPQLTLGETITGINDYATASSSIPSCDEDVDRQDVWYYLILDSDVEIDISVTNGFSLQLWEGDCNALTQVSNACATSTLQDISIIANTYYFLQVWSNVSGRLTTLGDFEITVQDSALSIDNLDLENFKAYPNPFKDELSLTSNRNIDQVFIYDLLGKLIDVKTIHSMHATLSLSEYESGIYFLKVFSGNASITQKIIKQ